MDSGKAFSNGTALDITATSWKTYHTIIFHINYGSAYYCCNFLVAYLKTRTSVRAAVVFNATTFGYISINSYTDSKINITIAMGADGYVALIGYK